MPNLSDIEKAVGAAAPFVGFVPVIGQALPVALQIISLFRKTRDSIEAVNPGTSGMMTDAELFDALQHDSTALVNHSADLIAKWTPKPTP